MEENYLKYSKEIIANIAQEIDMGMICFLNTDTMEFDSVLGESYDAYWTGDHNDLYREVYDKVDSWEHSSLSFPAFRAVFLKVMPTSLILRSKSSASSFNTVAALFNPPI